MPEIRIQRPSTRPYVAAGIAAIVAGGVVSAFSARHPNTFAMWASAYLVLVAGVAQICLGLALERLASSSSNKLGYAAFGLLVAGNVFVITGSAVKYAGLEWNMPVTATGSVLLVAALALVGWAIRGAKRSRLKAGAYVGIVGLAVCIPIGLVLAQR